VLDALVSAYGIVALGVICAARSISRLSLLLLAGLDEFLGLSLVATPQCYEEGERGCWHHFVKEVSRIGARLLYSFKRRPVSIDPNENLLRA
jgi:hypothetical protein